MSVTVYEPYLIIFHRCFRMTSRYEPRRIQAAKKKQEADETSERGDNKLSAVSQAEEVEAAGKSSSASKDSTPGKDGCLLVIQWENIRSPILLISTVSMGRSPIYTLV